MTIPDYETLMLPLLREASKRGDGGVSTRDAVQSLSDEFALTPEERAELLPSGRQAVINNRVGWAATYLKKAGLLQPKVRGRYIASARGLELLAAEPSEITNETLANYPEFVAFKVRRNQDSSAEPDSVTPEKSQTAPSDPTEKEGTPRERIEALAEAMQRELAEELLAAIADASPEFFERLVVDLLVRMGYGGTHREAGRAIGQSHDGGIDGIINEDRLGLDRVYVQAKRWAAGNNVGSPEVQKFAGALQGQRARKGVFITTSDFTNAARAFVSNIESKIVLINGEQLAEYMVEFGVGVSTTATLVLQRLDHDYFTEE